MHTIELNSHDKTSRYQQLLPQLAALIEDETDLTANLAGALHSGAFAAFARRHALLAGSNRKVRILEPRLERNPEHQKQGRCQQNNKYTG